MIIGITKLRKWVNWHKRDIPLSEQEGWKLGFHNNKIQQFLKGAFWWTYMANRDKCKTHQHTDSQKLDLTIALTKKMATFNLIFYFISIFFFKYTSISYIFSKIIEKFQPGSLDAAAVVDQTLQNLWWNILDQTMNLWMISKRKYRDIYEFKQQNNWKRLTLKYWKHSTRKKKRFKNWHLQVILWFGTVLSTKGYFFSAISLPQGQHLGHPPNINHWNLPNFSQR